MARVGSIFCAVLLLCTLAHGQEPSLTAKNRHTYIARGQVLALRFMQLQLIMHIAHEDGLDTARNLLSLAQDTFEEHLKETSTDTREQFSGLPESIRKEALRTAKRMSELHRKGGYHHFDSLHVLLGILESKMK